MYTVEPVSLDPYETAGVEAARVKRQVMEGLFEINDAGEYVPLLTEDPQVFAYRRTLDGEEQRGGTYGGPDSAARHKPQRGDGTYWFSGSGRLRVGGVSDGTTIFLR